MLLTYLQGPYIQGQVQERDCHYFFESICEVPNPQYNGNFTLSPEPIIQFNSKIKACDQAYCLTAILHETTWENAFRICQSEGFFLSLDSPGQKPIPESEGIALPLSRIRGIFKDDDQIWKYEFWTPGKKWRYSSVVNWYYLREYHGNRTTFDEKSDLLVSTKANTEKIKFYINGVYVYSQTFCLAFGGYGDKMKLYLDYCSSFKAFICASKQHGF